MGQIGTPVVRQNNKKGESEMTHAKDDSAISMALKQIIANGFKGLDTALSILINEAMRIERGRVFEAEPLQRTQNRKEQSRRIGASDPAGACSAAVLSKRP